MAANMTEPPETIEVEEATVSCDGGGTLGHPKIFLTLKDGRAECGYCDQLFVLKPGVKLKTGH